MFTAASRQASWQDVRNRLEAADYLKAQGLWEKFSSYKDAYLNDGKVPSVAWELAFDKIISEHCISGSKVEVQMETVRRFKPWLSERAARCEAIRLTLRLTRGRGTRVIHTNTGSRVQAKKIEAIRESLRQAGRLKEAATEVRKLVKGGTDRLAAWIQVYHSVLAKKTLLAKW